MPHGKIPAVFMRGGTSKALMFHRRDLPADPARWDAIFLQAMGSPDPNGRQLNGMGGGVTSTSKVCVIGPPTRPDADVDYTFAQVMVKEARVSYRGNCGNMSAAVGPFAVAEGLIQPAGDNACVRIHNTNTGKIIHARFDLDQGQPLQDGALAIPGVAGTAAPIELDFLDPGGAQTGRLLPGGHALQILAVEGVGAVEVSLVDAANPCVFVAAASLGLSGVEMPDALEHDGAAMARLLAIGAHAAVAMGLAQTLAQARERLPLIALVSAPQDNPTLSGQTVMQDAMDLVVRMLSSGQPHRALPGTGAICTAVAARIPGTLVQRLARPASAGPLRMAMPSGLLPVDATVHPDGPGWRASHGTLYRTARRLFEGWVHY